MTKALPVNNNDDENNVTFSSSVEKEVDSSSAPKKKKTLKLNLRMSALKNFSSSSVAATSMK